MSATTVKEDFMRVVQSILAAMGVRDPDEQDVSISVIVTVAVITVRARVRQNLLKRIARAVKARGFARAAQAAPAVCDGSVSRPGSSLGIAGFAPPSRALHHRAASSAPHPPLLPNPPPAPCV